MKPQRAILESMYQEPIKEMSFFPPEIDSPKSETRLSDSPASYVREGQFFHCIIGPLVIQDQHVAKTASKAFSECYERLIGHRPSRPETLSGGSGEGFIFGPSDTRNIIQSWTSCKRKDMPLAGVQTLIGVAESRLNDVESELSQTDAELFGNSGLGVTISLIQEARKHLVAAIECLRGNSTEKTEQIQA